jgi:hypothetical protein
LINDHISIQNLNTQKSVDKNLGLNIDLSNFESNGNYTDLLGQVKKVMEYNTNYVNQNQDDLETPEVVESKFHSVKNQIKSNTPNLTARSRSSTTDLVEVSERSKNENLSKIDNYNITNFAPILKKNPSNISNFSHISANDNIKLYNEFQNNLEDKIQNLKKKLDINSKSLSNNHNNQKNIIKLNYEKFKNFKSGIFVKLIYFFDSNDISHMMKLNKEIKYKILEIIKELCKNVVNYYEKEYLRMLIVENSLLIFKKSKKNKRVHLNINLVIKSKITGNNLKDKAVTIGYKSKFPLDKECLKNVYKFDVCSPGPLSFWVMREYTNVKIKNYFEKLFNCNFSFIKMN